MRVARDVMSKEPVCVDLGATVREVAMLLEEHEISGAPVIDGSGRLVGVVSRTDLMRHHLGDALERDPRLLIELSGDDDAIAEASDEVLVEDFMTDSPVTVRPQTPLQDVAGMMSDAEVHRVIVVDDEYLPIGIVTSLDLVRVLARTARS